MNCRNMKSKLEEMLLAPEKTSQATRDHLAGCESCRRELAELQATFALLDEWQAPEVNEYFPVRMQALLREEQTKKSAGWLERLHMRMLLQNHTARPVAAVALALALLIGGGTYAGMETLASHQSVVTPKSATLRDLQSLDQNAQVFQQLNDIDQYDSGGSSGNTGSL
jgi:anti-sigma factor RsiW